MPNKHSFSAVGNDISIERSTFDIPFRHLTTGNFGTCIPFYLMECLPGDTFDVNTNIFCRMSTPRFPVMDDAYVEYNYFFVPLRLVYDRWAEFLGENKYTAWTQPVDYIIPHAKVVPTPGDVYDHMEVPTYDTFDNWYEDYVQSPPAVDINILPQRAYWLIWNEWYRNENTTDPVLVNTGDDVTGPYGSDPGEVERYRHLARAAKPFDVFTSALPAPQKGEAVTFGLADVPVVTSYFNTVDTADANVPLRFQSIAGGINDRRKMLGVSTTPTTATMDSATSVRADALGSESDDILGPLNLKALTSMSHITINELRQAFAMQRLLELQARTGSRAVEIIAASFGVRSSDARFMRPQYLGGKTVLINMTQVQQNSATVEGQSPLGTLGAFSKTVATNHDFVTSFTEHGYVIGIAVARHRLSYQQGLAKHYSRRARYDFYWPNFAHIGEQPIKKKEIFYSNSDDVNEEPFGYQEAWYEYRYKPNAVTGAFRSTVHNNLDEWHYADIYADPSGTGSGVPVLSDGWMNASSVAVDRTLAVTSALHDQLLFDISVDLKATRPMPLYSTPGLIDHF